MAPQGERESRPIKVRSQSVTRTDFSGQALRGSDLYDCNAEGTNWSGADISFSNASKAKFNHADMSNVKAVGVSFSKASFNYADLSGADLTGSSTFGCTWQGADLQNCTLPEGWKYETFIQDIVPALLVKGECEPKKVLSHANWKTGLIKVAFPNGVPPHLQHVARRAAQLVDYDHLRREQLRVVLKDKGLHPE